MLIFRKFAPFLVFGLIFCQWLFFSPAAAQLTVEQREAQLRAELETTEREIAVWQAELRRKQKESASFERDIAVLNAKIKQAQAAIRAGNLEIERLGRDINLKLETIGQLDAKIERGRESLSQLLRKVEEVQSFSLVEVMLSRENLSEFLVDLDDFESVQESLQKLFKEIRLAKSELQRQKEELEIKQNREIDVKKANEAEKRRVEINEAEQKKLLTLSRGQERTYEQVIAERQRKAAQIRATLFALRDTAAIPFGDALRFAEEAQRLTGVRPAFLLAIITQESNMGVNIGTCNRPQDALKWRDIMPAGGTPVNGRTSARNDQAAYLRITSELGFDPNSMPLSCPWGGGWGGAMGPAQFIPTTWEIYKSKIAAILKKSPPNPWEPRDALTAAAVYLSELGAEAGGYSAERTAALKYYAGGNWNKPQNAFYGDQVMAHARRIQEEMIDPLNF